MTPRPTRRLVATALAIAGAAIAAAAAYVAAPNNSWYLPGQTVTLRTAVENHVNGHVVVVAVADDNASGTVAVDDRAPTETVVPGDTVTLDWAGHLKVRKIDGPAIEAGTEVADGGTGAIVFQVTLW